jgi:hypothetical protein
MARRYQKVRKIVVAKNKKGCPFARVVSSFMKNLTFIKMSSKKILIAPLDWGLGHAARCIPIIRQLVEKKAEVMLGGSGLSGKLLQMEFPSLPYYEIPGYEVTYSSKSSMAVTMLRQAPGILKAIQQEKKWLEEFIRSNPVDIVISDHRYGLHNKNAYNIFIAHQLFISSGNHDLLEPVLWKINKSYIENFNECWIPDLPGENNASGKLSHKLTPPFPHQFIGLLSRLDPGIQSEKKYKACFILSGLEPLRTDLENLIIDQLDEFKEGNFMLIRGTQKHIQKDPPPFLSIIDLADSTLTNQVIGQSELMISRSGYSSIMDYLVTQTKALLIPTPGQTEQEYLAKYHLESGNFYAVQQSEFNLASQLSLALSYSPQFTNQPSLLDLAVNHLLAPHN